MRIKFNKTWDYAHDGLRVVRYQEGQIVDTDEEKVDETFVRDCCERDKVASVVENKAMPAAPENKAKR